MTTTNGKGAGAKGAGAKNTNANATFGADLAAPEHYINREISWLGFNDRVLHEALDERTPLIERLKFLAIFSSNLDEFFMVRLSGVMEQASAGVDPYTPDGLTAAQQLTAVRAHLLQQVSLQNRIFETQLRPALRDHGVYLVDYDDLNTAQRTYLHQHFQRRIFPVLTPLSVDPSHPFPRLSNLSLNLAVQVVHPKDGTAKLARIKVPDSLPRFLRLPQPLAQHNGEDCLWLGVPLEQVIAAHLDALFPGMEMTAHHLFRITRDADFPVRENEADDLLLAIQQEVSKRRLDGVVCRLEVDAAMPEELRQMLAQELVVDATAIYPVEGLLNHTDLFAFAALPLPNLKDTPWQAKTSPALRAVLDVSKQDSSTYVEQPPDIFAAIRRRDIMVHHPYESFTASVQEFITQAATDPQVLAIKMTLYRTSGDSPIIQALIQAAENHKQVVALVELKARFDEENNIVWARKLEEAGVHVVYGIAGLKTHTKITLVVREEEEDGEPIIRRYGHIGTGNYNPKTSKLYTDLGLLSCREELGADLSDLFNFLTGFSQQTGYRQLLVAPKTLRSRIEDLIRREMEHAAAGRPARMVIKINSLVDGHMIRLLYEASQAGVEIDLIVRGICCLRPRVPGVSNTIRVISVIGRFLEHSRILRFENDGDPAYYIGSADWMTRNLDRRVEAMTPILEPKLQAELDVILDTMLQDNRQAWDMAADGTFTQRRPIEGEPDRGTHRLLMARTLERSKLT